MTTITLDDSQHEAVSNILKNRNRTVVLCGGGGFGKSTVIKNITIEAIENYGVSPSKIFFCATTGKAAEVLQHSIAQLGMPQNAMTIHRMLGCRGVEWVHGTENMLNAELVFVDESSYFIPYLIMPLLFLLEILHSLILLALVARSMI